VALAGVVALGAPTRQADAAITEKVVFASDRTTGTGVNNPTGDFEIFRMNADGTGIRQLTTNKVGDFGPVLSPDKTKIAYHSSGSQPSNPEGDYEVNSMSALDGRGQKNLSNNGDVVDDDYPFFSSDGTRIFYESEGAQDSNLQGDIEIYRLNTLDGKGKKNLTNNAAIEVVYPD
jgi:Tol biopolymer transport system component